MSASALWDELIEGEWATLTRWRLANKPESLHLDFKAAEVHAGDVRPDDRKNLAKGLSGFANSEGGLLVFGATTRRGDGKEDVLEGLPGVTPLPTYAERLRIHARSSTTPAIPNLDVRSFEDPNRLGTGIVVAYVPLTDSVPFRAEGFDHSVSGRYWMRTTTDTIVASHQYLATMFGRRPLPSLRAGVLEVAGKSVVVIENRGRGPAVTPFVRIHVGEHSPSTVSPRGSWVEKQFDAVFPGSPWQLGFGLLPGAVVYPGEQRQVAAFDTRGQRNWALRIDCENGPAVSFQGEVLPPPGEILWLDPT